MEKETMHMKYCRNQLFAFSLALALALSLLPAQVLAFGDIAEISALPLADSEPFIDNPRWHEVDSDTITQKYNNGETFVAVYFRTNCLNSQMRRTIVSKWMDSYGIDIYGVDYAQYGLPKWMYAQISNGSAKLPVICIVEQGTPHVFTGNDSIRSVQKQLQESFDIYDDSQIDFHLLDGVTYSAYSTDASYAEQFLIPLSPDAASSEMVITAQEAVRGLTTDREKVKAIYDWVTTNIFYNYGIYEGDEKWSYRDPSSAWETFYYKNGVCIGYANLTALMCNSVGIPCRTVTGFATGIETDEVVTDVWAAYDKYLENHDRAAFESTIKPYANHAWNEAYVDGEWLILDTTWGSNNDLYPNGFQIKGIPTDAYFDPDFEWFSQSHLFWTVYSNDTSGASRSLTAICEIDLRDVGRARHYLMVTYDRSGRMLESTAAKIIGSTAYAALADTQVDRVRLFLLDGGYAPVCASGEGTAASW